MVKFCSHHGTYVSDACLMLHGAAAFAAAAAAAAAATAPAAGSGVALALQSTP